MHFLFAVHNIVSISVPGKSSTLSVYPKIKRQSKQRSTLVGSCNCNINKIHEFWMKPDEIPVEVQ